MYAVVATGGKQYRVSAGDRLRVEKLTGEPGDKVKLDQVLLVAGEGEPRIGRPSLDGAVVEAEIVRQGRGPKVYHFRKWYHSFTRIRGHRQPFTELKILGIRG